MDMDEFRSSLKADIDDQAKKNQDASDRARAHAEATLKTFFDLASETNRVIPDLVKVNNDTVNEDGTYEVDIIVGTRRISFAAAPHSGAVAISGINDELNAAIPADFERKGFVNSIRQSYDAVNVKLEQMELAAKVFADVIRFEARKTVAR